MNEGRQRLNIIHQSLVRPVLLATAGHWALVQAAKIDPQLSQVYIRHWRYQQDCYPARASIWAPAPARVRPTVPTPREVRE